MNPSQPRLTADASRSVAAPLASPIAAATVAASPPVRDESGTNSPTNDAAQASSSISSLPAPAVPPVTVSGSAASSSASESRPSESGRDKTEAGHQARSGYRRPYITDRDIRRLAVRLSPRDWAVLRSVAEHRFLTTRQLSELHFEDSHNQRTTRRALARLRRWNVLATLERQIGGSKAGSEGLVFSVDVAGERLLRLDSAARFKRRWYEPSARFAGHHLAIAEVHLRLIRADRMLRAGESVREPSAAGSNGDGVSGSDGLELLRCDIEPACWRSYQTLACVMTLRPDLYVEVAPGLDSSYQYDAFIEVDLGTESIPTLMRKCREYQAYWRTGIEQMGAGDNDGTTESNHDGRDDQSDPSHSQTKPFPLVIWQLDASDPARAERRRVALRRAIAADQRLREIAFQVISPDQLLPLLQKGDAL